MAVKSSKNSQTVAEFRTAIKAWLDETGKTKSQAAREFGLSAGNFGEFINDRVALSLPQMEHIALVLGRDFLSMVQNGRAILEGNAAPQTAADTEEGFTPEQVQAIEAFKFVLRNQSDSHARMLITNIETYAAEKQGQSSSNAINPTDQKLSKSA